MIQLTPHMRIYQCIKPVDFRKGIDGLAAICRRHLQQDPFDGTLFIFINRKKTSMKLLVYDGQGFWLCQKRLSRGRIRHWNSHEGFLSAPQLNILLCNGSPHESKLQEPWKKI